MTTIYTQDATPTNPFGIGYHEQMVDISKRLIREREAKEAELRPLVNDGPLSFSAVRNAVRAYNSLAADPAADPAVVAAEKNRVDELRAQRNELTREYEQNNRLLQDTQRGLVENEDRLAQARAKAASQPANRPIVNPGADPAGQTPPSPTNLTGAVPPAEPLNVVTPAALAASPLSATNTAAERGRTSTPEPVVGDEALQAADDAAIAAAAIEEGRAFTPPPVTGDEALQAFEDAQAQDLAVQEGSAFAVPVAASGDEALQAIEDNNIREQAFIEGAAFAPPVSAAGDEALQAFEDAALAAREGSAFAGLGDTDAEDRVEAARFRARSQSTLMSRTNTPSAADWRVRLQLAPGADYLYRAGDAGILKPLEETDGVIFPYTPQIDTVYKANYDPYDLVHSNYRGYFYKSSGVGEISIKGTFTAQDTKEAQYLLAVIHFFRSVTKMFYGQDSQRGAPPPLVFLSGFGQYQYNKHPCLVANFNYSLPTDVDYIRADGFNNYGVNLENRRSRSSGPAPGGALSFIRDKLKINGLFPGAQPQTPAPQPVTQNVNNTNAVNSTYVPTRMDISLSLLPVQTRNQVSKQFSVQNFANGNLLKGGFW